MNGIDARGLKKLSTKLVRVNDAGEIQVYVVLTEWRPEHVAELEALGLRVDATVPTRRLIQGWVPSHALDDIAALDAVKEVKPPASTITNRPRCSMACAAASRMRRQASCCKAPTSATASQRTRSWLASSCMAVVFIPA